MRTKKNNKQKLGLSILAIATIVNTLSPTAALAATNEQSMGVAGTVDAISTIDITIPIKSLDFHVDNDGNLTAEQKTVTNNTSIPVYAYVTEVYKGSENAPSIVNTSAHDDWSSLSYDETKSEIALQINSKELAPVYHANDTELSDSSDYVALGKIESGATLNMDLTGKAGKDWKNARDISFNYNANMIFTTIEDIFNDPDDPYAEYVSRTYKKNTYKTEWSQPTKLAYDKSGMSGFSLTKPSSSTITGSDFKVDYVGYKICDSHVGCGDSVALIIKWSKAGGNDYKNQYAISNKPYDESDCDKHSQGEYHYHITSETLKAKNIGENDNIYVTFSDDSSKKITVVLSKSAVDGIRELLQNK